MLGVSPGPPDQTYFKCECGYRCSGCHHASYKISGSQTWRHNHVQASVRLGGTTAGLNTSWELNEGQAKDKEYGEKEYGADPSGHAPSYLF